MKLNIKKSRLEIHQTTKNKALEYLQYIPEELKAYQKGAKEYKKKDFSIVNLNELVEAIGSSQLIFLGDFHTFDQSSKNLERLLKTFFTSEKELTLGVEFVSIKHQKHIDNYLKGNITEREFLESINYRESWRFPWIHYKIFFQLAKQNKFKIIGLNSEGSLINRDHEAARVIIQNLNKNPDQHFFILFGELHILPEKLPKICSELGKNKFSNIIIHQNLEEIYWRIYEQDEKKASESIIVKFSNQEFSLQNSPPWIKYESMIYWYENLCDDPEFDLHDYIIETGLKSFNENIYENFHFICKQLNETLNFNLLDSDLEDFNIYDHRSLETTLRKLYKSSLSDEDKIFFEGLLHQGELFNIPGTNIYYCSSYSINRISILAGFHIYNLILNQTSLPKTKENILVYFIYMNYVGYFSSKVFNPFRKCDLYIDLHKKSQQYDETSWQKACLTILNDEFLIEKIGYLDSSAIFLIGRQIGNILADFSFYSSNENNLIFEKIINLAINRDFSYENLRSVINTIILQNPNFFQKTKTIL